MKRTVKTLLCAAVAVILGSGSCFAQGRKKMNHTPNHNRPERTDSRIAHSPKTALMGQITFVDEKNESIKIEDADGKETVVLVNPFTKINVNNSRSENGIKDLKKGDWIMYSLFNTDTEKKTVSHIFVKNN